MYSSAVEDYLQAIYRIQETRPDPRVPTQELADFLNVSPASVTGMNKKLAEMGLADLEPYRGVMLTEPGTREALRVIRQHRLAELLLQKVLNVPWDRVHQEAHRLEHAMSNYLTEHIDRLLDFPTHDPHGAPIPHSDGTVDRRPSVQLAQLQPGQSATIFEVNDGDADMLRYLADLNMRPNARLLVVSTEPFQGPMTVRIGNNQVALGPELTQNVFVGDVSS